MSRTAGPDPETIARLRLRPCQVIDNLYGGGQERVAVELARALGRAGYPSGMLATRSGGDYEQLLEEEPVLRLVMSRRNRHDLKAWATIARWLARNRFNVVHTHSPGSLAAMQRLKRVPWLRFALIQHVQMLPPRGTEFRESAIRYQREAADTVDLTIVTNEHLRRHLVEQCGYSTSSVIEMANPVNFARWERESLLPLDGPYPERWSATDRPLIAMVAQWRRQKDHETAIRAVAELAASGQKARLMLIGEPDATLTERGHRLVAELGLEEDVWIAGRRRDVPALLARADIGLLATHFEGLPVATIEYGASALPIVISDVEGTEAVTVEGSGVTPVPPANPSALAAALRPLLADPALRAERAAVSTRFLRELCDEPRFVERVVDVYRRALTPSVPVSQ